MKLEIRPWWLYWLERLELTRCVVFILFQFSFSIVSLQTTPGPLTFVDFGDISMDPSSLQAFSEIDDYLRLPIENVSNPLKWWVDKQCVYPRLSRMALDYLSVPGMFISTFYKMV